MEIDNWTEWFVGIVSLSQSVQGRLIKATRLTRIKKGKVTFSPARTPDSLLFLFSRAHQSVSKFKHWKRNRALPNYCERKLSSNHGRMLAEEGYNAEGVNKTDVSFIALPKPDLVRLVSKEEIFRKFVFAAYSRRLIDLLWVWMIWLSVRRICVWRSGY